MTQPGFEPTTRKENINRFIVRRILCTGNHDRTVILLLRGSSVLPLTSCISNLILIFYFLYFYLQPDDESPLLLLDLPKECLQKILLHMSDHRDILRFGSTCSYLHELTKDPYLWREMCLTQFTEKQLPLYVFCVELNEVDWLKIYKTCFK